MERFSSFIRNSVVFLYNLCMSSIILKINVNALEILLCCLGNNNKEEVSTR